MAAKRNIPQAKKPKRANDGKSHSPTRKDRKVEASATKSKLASKKEEKVRSAMPSVETDCPRRMRKPARAVPERREKSPMGASARATGGRARAMEKLRVLVRMGAESIASAGYGL
jgi:hypothetical protein